MFIRPTQSVYSVEQLKTYLDVIGFSSRFGSFKSASPRTTLRDLCRITRLHLLSFPFENIQMHYTESHRMDITPNGLFQRMVLRGQGSYCFGQNTLLLEMLKAFGYRVYSGLGRVNRESKQDMPPKFGTLSHMVIFAQVLDEIEQTYLVDVGFGGGTGLARPILLAEGGEAIGATRTQKHRLIKETPEMSSLDDVKQWHLQVCHSDNFQDQDHVRLWRTVYGFSETEYFQEDYQNASYIIDSMPLKSIFGHTISCVKYFPIADEDNVDVEIEDAPLGKITMFEDVVKRSVGGEVEILKLMKTEDDRITELTGLFNLSIEPDDAKYIQGRIAAFST